MCCLQGQVKLDAFSEPPSVLHHLFSGSHQHSKVFKQHIHSFNSALAMTSVGVQVDHAVTNASGPYCFRIHGELSHQIAPLMPREGSTASYAQLYIHDPAEANRIRNEHNNQNNIDPTVHSAIFAELQNTLHATHPYIPLFKQAFQILREKPAHLHKDVQVRLRLTEDNDAHRYNLPTVDEIAAVIPGSGEEKIYNGHEILLRLNGGGL
ncbi:hypothetical protein C8J56DRAFT_1049677 [Mycena floridula]|nr:hypothetical protein C8J56DRAFT_1049677 [Mycena floridula]